MRKRKVKRSRPMFKKKRSPARTAFNVILVVVLLLGIAFLGYSVGKPVVDFIKNREDRPADIQIHENDAESSVPEQTEPLQTEPTEQSTEQTEVPEPEPKNGILFIKMPEDGSYEAYLTQKISQAQEDGYYGVAVELLCDGGKIGFMSANEKALLYSASAENAITDLVAAASAINEAGLVPYARISLLTDHIVSWDKSICYLFENSTSTWLDDSAANGGRPWISAFSQSARDYISSLVTEVSQAGFAGIIAGEVKFPPFRSSDLSYVGATVQSSGRYKGLIDFSNAVQTALGNAKSYAIEVNAEDIIAGKAEVLNDPASLNCNTVYVRYDSEAVGLRIERADGTEVSYEGLSEQDKLTVVFKSVSDAMSQSNKKIIPAISDASLIEKLKSLGYDEQMILIY